MPTKYIKKNNGYRNQSHSGKKRPPTGTVSDLNTATLSRLFTDETAAREFIENERWPNGTVCPHCDHTDCYRLTAKEGSKSPVRPGVWKCKACRKQFTVRVGTIFEDSKIPIHKWVMAIHLMTSSKKGVSSHQIAREVDVTVKSAWFMTHRIREAMKLEPMAGMLSGAVEVDEAYIGGKPHVPGISKQAVILTDDNTSYDGIGENFDGGHEVVNHSKKEYSRIHPESGLPINTNTAESFFALLKRSHFGIHHHMSKKHLHRYCTERGFMWNGRKQSDGHRMVAAIKGAEGKRLMYREPKAG